MCHLCNYHGLKAERDKIINQKASTSVGRQKAGLCAEQHIKANKITAKCTAVYIASEPLVSYDLRIKLYTNSIHVFCKKTKPKTTFTPMLCMSLIEQGFAFFSQFFSKLALHKSYS